jgi:CBS domain-containing protein
MKLSKVLSEKGSEGKVHTIAAGSTIKTAAKKLCELRIGCLLVVAPGVEPVKYLGVLSERDIIRAMSSDEVDVNKEPIDIS